MLAMMMSLHVFVSDVATLFRPRWIAFASVSPDVPTV